jgi:hypothetical protein
MHISPNRYPKPAFWRSIISKFRQIFSFADRPRHVNPNGHATGTTAADPEKVIASAFRDRMPSRRDTESPVVGEQSAALGGTQT